MIWANVFVTEQEFVLSEWLEFWIIWDATSAGFTLGQIDEASGDKDFTTGQTGSLLNDDFLPDGLYTSANSFGKWTGDSRYFCFAAAIDRDRLKISWQ